MAETLVVVTIAITVLTLFYRQISTTYNNYEQSFNYDTVETIHAANNIKEFILQEGLDNLITALGSDDYLDITNYAFSESTYFNNLRNALNIKKIYFTPYNIVSLKNNAVSYGFSVPFIEYLKSINVISSQVGKYRLITISNDGHYTNIIVETTLPLVFTDDAASSVESTTATVGGDVYAINGGSITERGIVYGANINPTTSDSKVVVAGTTGEFSADLTGLTPGETYHVRAYAINSAGTNYGEDITFSTTVSGVDEYTVLMLHMDGVDNGTTITDETGKVITLTGDVVTKTNIKKFGTASVYFDGAGDYLSLPDSTDFDFGTGDFTIDFWIYQAGSVQFWLGATNNYADIQGFAIRCFSGNNSPEAFYTTGNGSYSWESYVSGSAPTGEWVHIAVVRENNTYYSFQNGVLVDTKAISIDIQNNPIFEIGRAANKDALYFNGYLDEVRISKGIARWTSNFTPPTAPYSG